MPSETISFLKSFFSESETQFHGKNFRVEKVSDELTTFSFRIKVRSIIWPSREGELISNINSLPSKFSYSLTYPGTASTKSLVLFLKKNRGIFIGGRLTDEFCRLSLKKVGESLIEVSFTSKEHDFIFIPFVGDWRNSIEDYKKFYGIPQEGPQVTSPKYLLQIGAIAPESIPKFGRFKDLTHIIDRFSDYVGKGHIIHFFGTDSAGFDRMFPRYEISNDLGGEVEFIELLDYIHKKGLLTSHHFIPRIADYDWVKENPEFKEAVVMSSSVNSVPIVELYKSHPFYVMNPNNTLWFNKCIETIKRLHGYGIDYVQLDQFTYQRNFYQENVPLIKGYRRLVNEVEKLGIKYWLEGVSDLFNPSGSSFAQILIRNVPNVWDDFEIRRGYVYGDSYPEFFTSLYPNRNYSYQLITENKSIESFNNNLEIARKIKATVYDFQMDYYGDTYNKLLEQVIERVEYIN